MRIRLGGQIAARTLLGATLLAASASGVESAEPARRLVDPEGVIHVTNVPADPRYRGLPGASGTAAGWLRLPGQSWPRYAAEIREIADQHGVSPVLVEAVVRAESSFDPRAVSAKGAAGLMQLMPETASALGVRDRFDPRESIRGGVRHLRYLLERYQGSVPNAVAAYNAGEKAVDAHGGIPPYPETQLYVRRVLQGAGLADASPPADVMYRYTEPDHTEVYSNIPPRPRPRSAGSR